MAVLTLDAKRRVHELHGGYDLIGGKPFEHLNVFVNLFGSLLLRG